MLYGLEMRLKNISYGIILAENMAMLFYVS